MYVKKYCAENYCINVLHIVCDHNRMFGMRQIVEIWLYLISLDSGFPPLILVSPPLNTYSVFTRFVVGFRITFLYQSREHTCADMNLPRNGRYLPCTPRKSTVKLEFWRFGAHNVKFHNL